MIFNVGIRPLPKYFFSRMADVRANIHAKNTSAEAYLQLNVASRAANRAALMWSALAIRSRMLEASLSRRVKMHSIKESQT